MSNFRPKHKPFTRRALLPQSILVVLVLLVVFIVLYSFAPAFFAEPLIIAAHTVWNVRDAFSPLFSGTQGFLRLKKQLAAENAALKKENKRLVLRDAQLRLLSAEYARLSELLGRRSDASFVTGRVLVRPPVSLYDTLVIDVGEGDGVEEGDFVLGEELVIGTVVRTQNNTSLVQLFSASGVRIQVQVGSEHIPVEAVGKGSGNFSARLPRDATINRGDFVTIPELGARLFSTVEEIRTEATDPFQTLLFRIPLSISTLDFVEVTHSVETVFDEIPKEESI